MSVPLEQLERAIAAARVRESQGYFTKVKAGDQKAASLFARLVALDLNPSGKSTDFGWLSKSPGESQVDGYAEDAICWTADPANRENVLDMVNGAGAPGASIGGGVKERREHNTWVKPVPLSQAQLDYLLAGAQPGPTPLPPVIPPPGRKEALDEQKFLHAYYMAAEGLQRPKGLWRDDTVPPGPDFEGIAAWYLDVYQRERMAGKTREQARAAYVKDIRHSTEWRAKHPGETP